MYRSSKTSHKTPNVPSDGLSGDTADCTEGRHVRRSGPASVMDALRPGRIFQQNQTSPCRCFRADLSRSRARISCPLSIRMEQGSARQSLAGLSQHFPMPVEIMGENPPPRVLSEAQEEISLGCHRNHSPLLQLLMRNGFYNIRLQASQVRKKPLPSMLSCRFWGAW